MKNLKRVSFIAFALIAFEFPVSCQKVDLKPQFVVTPDAPVTDNQGNVYKTVKIGNQVWMAENLKVTKYRNGDPIALVTSNSGWASSNSGAYCFYGNDEENLPVYGTLYNWYAIVDTRQIAPEGWHIPSDAEWQTLISYLGGEKVAGGKMKEEGTSHWKTPNFEATNSSLLTALPGGLRHYDGSFGMLNEHGSFWSTTPYGSSEAWIRDIYYQNVEVFRCEFAKKSGFSVRCVKE